MLTLSCIGSAIGVTMGGNTTVAGLKKKPEIFGKSMLLCVLPSTQGLYGFAGFFLMLSRLGAMEDASQVLTMNQGLAMAAAGLALGFVGLWSAIKQASLVSNGINEMSNGHDVFSRTMILAVRIPTRLSGLFLFRSLHTSFPSVILILVDWKVPGKTAFLHHLLFFVIT